jgi:hypothetical protein
MKSKKSFFFPIRMEQLGKWYESWWCKMNSNQLNLEIILF